MTILISYRKASLEDLHFLSQLRKLTMSEHLDNAGIVLTELQHLERVKEYFNDSQIILLNGKAIGLLKLAVLAESLHIRQFQILPKVQGKGVGSKVLTDVIKRAKQRNLSITLNVLLANPAKALYLRHGFNIIKQNKVEYLMRYNV
jgi:ribosomal protein S18 acetylase RimI-like enzyme